MEVARAGKAFVDELDKYFADVGLYILIVGWIEPDYVSLPLAFCGLRCLNESDAEYSLFLSAVSYSVFAVLKISSLDELSDSRLLIEVGMEGDLMEGGLMTC